MVVGKHRKRPYRLQDHIAAYTLDNKASLAILIELAARIRSPVPDVYLVATAKEEVGGIGALHFVRHHSIDALVAFEIAPVAPEYPIVPGPDPVLVMEDSYGIYDDSLNRELRRSAEEVGSSLQLAVLNGFGSDGSITMKAGGVARAACLGFPAENTDGFEIAHLGALSNMANILVALCNGDGISKLAAGRFEGEGAEPG
jgi:putative aminopeptidase FrvX